MATIKYLGHASLEFITNEGIVIYVDPFIGDYKEEADFILVTHEHYDHNQVDKVPHKKETITIRYNVLKKGPFYNKTSAYGVTIEAVEAYNKKHDKNACVGYVVSFDGINIYVAGDTSLTEDMKNKLLNYNLDYAFLPVDGIYNMNALEASECAKLISSKHTIPYHTNPEEIYDEKIAKEFVCDGVVYLKPNEIIEIKKEDL